MEATDFDLNRRFAATVAGSDRLTTPEQAEIRHLRFDTDLQAEAVHPGQVVGVVRPAENGLPHFRLYSVCGIEPRPGGCRLAICVKRVFVGNGPNGRSTGRASGYLCDLTLGESVELLGPFGHPFAVPEDRTAPLLMVGAGTGIAPFRAFVQRIYREHGGWLGPVRLFHGAHTGLELVYQNDYQNDFESYYDEETFRAIQVVRGYVYNPKGLSREGSLTYHVQEARALLEHPKSHLYVSGTRGLQLELERLWRIEFGRSEWEERKSEMRATGRWTEILY